MMIENSTIFYPKEGRCLVDCANLNAVLKINGCNATRFIRPLLFTNILLEASDESKHEVTGHFVLRVEDGGLLEEKMETDLEAIFPLCPSPPNLIWRHASFPTLALHRAH
ncbi:unnamed protein product [Protopolystoma xenopodis]|uniref:Uncharacterized protein n=1 Tax=Protopolystoma xenopodis TaxID=117903 RepID=A0A448WTE6_9PLAT|nr:unnamed protein product [Protopolystoma xenopodis]